MLGEGIQQSEHTIIITPLWTLFNFCVLGSNVTFQIQQNMILHALATTA